MDKLKVGLLNDFRKYFFDPAERGTEKTELFSGNGEQVTFELSQPSLMFVKTVKVYDVDKKLNRDYYIDFGTGSKNGTITFITAPSEDDDNIEVVYEFGSNWIYPGFPQDISRNMPRMGLMLTGARHKPAGMSEKAEYVDASFRLGIWVKSGGGEYYTINGMVYSGDKLLDYLYNDISQKVIALRRDYDEPYNVITIKIGNVTDIPFDEENKISRKELSIDIMYKKMYD